AQAALIANAVAERLVQLSPLSPGNPEAQLKVQMRNQIKKIEGSIPGIETRIQQLQADLQDAIYLEKQRLVVEQLTEERRRLSDSLDTVTKLYESLQQIPTNQVKIIEPAFPGTLADSQLKLKVLIGGIAGLILALTFALAFEYLDNTVKTVDDLVQTTGGLVLGVIAKHKLPYGVGAKRFVVQALPTSTAAENYRMLGTKLLSNYKAHHNRILAENPNDNGMSGIKQLLSNDKYPLRSVVISSSNVGDDTSEIAANLAIVLAQTGRRVMLVDAYLHRSTVGQLFGLVDQGGLTRVLSEQSPVPELIPVDWAPGLSILPSDPVPPNPFELLTSSRMAELIEELESQADIVIITMSPLASFADTFFLASRVDGVVIVARSGQTHRRTISDAVESLRSLDAHIIGTVLDYNHSGAPFSPVGWKTISALMPNSKPGMKRMPADQPHKVPNLQKKSQLS
ncbi:MAG: polysaccharide biosynthesis tyrosine autokinase, partial [Chloroflexota bacterium]